MEATLQSGAAGLAKITPPLVISVSLGMNSLAILLDAIASAAKYVSVSFHWLLM